jgi:hypothetical protein
LRQLRLRTEKKTFARREVIVHPSHLAIREEREVNQIF